MTRAPQLLQIQTTEPPDDAMIQVAPNFASDEEYDCWLQQVHEEIGNEGEDDADYRQKREN